MAQVETKNLHPVLLAQFLLASVKQERDLSQYGQSTMDFETLRALDKLTSDAIEIVRGLVNWQPPIGRLPTELLVDIFALVPRRCETGFQSQVRGGWYSFESDKLWRVEDLRPITAVCRQWRELALATPALWSTFLSDQSPTEPWRPLKVDFFKHYIHRCPVGPIYVTLRGTMRDTRVMESLDEVRARVRELCVGDSRLDGYDGLRLPHFPNLERCAWEGTRTDTQRPHPLRFCDSPRLRFLELLYPPCLPAASYPALTDLTIIGPNVCGDFDQLLRLLSSSPRLRYLTVGELHDLNNIPLSDSESDPSDAHTRKVPLPVLQRLQIMPPSCTTHIPLMIDGWRDPSQEFRRALICSLTFPLSCALHLDRMLIEDLHYCFRDIPHICMATRLSMSWMPDTPVYAAEEATLEFSTEDWSLRVSVRLMLCSTADCRQGWLLDLRDVLSAPQFSSIRKVSLGALPDSLYGVLHPSRILGAFAQLTLLRVTAKTRYRETTVEELTESLAHQLQALQNDAQDADADTDTDADAGPPACPLLARLWVDWPRMPYSPMDEDHDDADWHPSSIMDQLRDLARARAAQGRPFSRVFVSHAVPSPSHVAFAGAMSAYTVDEYDGGFTRVLGSRTLGPDGQDGGPLEKLFWKEWARVDYTGAEF